MTAVTLCQAPRHGDDAPEAEPHALLCGPCRRGLSRDLRRLPGLHADLENNLINEAASGTGYIAYVGKGRGASADDDGDLRHLLKVTPLPFNDAVSECRSQIAHDLTWWFARVFALQWPKRDWRFAGSALNPVAAMAGYLHGQVTWCSFRDWVPDMAAVFAADAGWAMGLLQPRVTRQFEVQGPDGLCPACGDAHAEVTIYASDDDRRRSFIACPACGQRWEPEQWMRYGQQVVKRRETMAS